MKTLISLRLFIASATCFAAPAVAANYGDSANQNNPAYYGANQDDGDGDDSAYITRDSNQKIGEVNIVETLSSENNFNTLMKALTAADLLKMLKGSGPFTIFAPNDKAFAKLPADTLSDLLKPENKDKLIAILNYHIVPSKIMTAEIKADKLKTVNGKVLDLQVKDDKVTVNGANVLQGEWDSSNGIILEIDTVLMP